MPIGRRLLVDQRGKPGPQRRRRARASPVELHAVVGNDPNPVRNTGHVGAIAQGGRASVTGHVNTSLVVRDGVVCAKAAPARRRLAGKPAPNLLRHPGCARTARRDRGPAHYGDIGVLRWGPGAAGGSAIGAIIPRSLKERLPLRGKLEEHLVLRLG